MKRNLTFKETITITSMLFGMFFGAGNLIFPAKLGIDAGSNLFAAFLGVFITAVGIPMLAVVALGISRSEGIVALSGKVSKRYSKFFCTLLYLTIGPLFAIPRCASASFSVGAVNLLPQEHQGLYLALFSAVFFLLALIFSRKPGAIMTWIGKFLNPIFLVFLFILIFAALIHPIIPFSKAVPAEAYATGVDALFRGFLEGYNTLDALAGLAFGIVVVHVVRNQGITAPERVAACTAKAGIFSCLFMGVIYLFITIISTQSTPICGDADNGGVVLGLIAHHYFRSAGAILITAIVTLACLKTAIGLITSCSEAFMQMFPKGPSYGVWAILFSVVSFGIANFGLSTIVSWCVPVLMFLYPLSITLVILALTGKLHGHSSKVYLTTTVFTILAALLDFLGAMADILPNCGFLTATASFAGRVVPLYTLGLGWVCPATAGFLIGLAWERFGPHKAQR